MQVPQYLLDAGIEAGSGASTSIICTQPRRIAAISVAERVCQEREDTPPGGNLCLVLASQQMSPTCAVRHCICAINLPKATHLRLGVELGYLTLPAVHHADLVQMQLDSHTSIVDRPCEVDVTLPELCSSQDLQLDKLAF